MSALTLYTKTLRMILNLRQGEDVSWVPILESFCDFRESLLCGVCLKLTVLPYQRSTVHCSHNVCRACLGGKLQVPCLWCADEKNFEDNAELRLLLQSYKQMCKYIMSCEFYRNLFLSDISLPKLNFISMVTEGSKYDDDYQYTSTPKIFGNGLRLLFNVEPENIQNINGRKTLYRLHLNPEKATVMNNVQDNGSDADKHTGLAGGLSSFLFQKSYTAQRQRTCHCGITSTHQKKLTCRGQKCPCFVAGRSCFNCRCRGCRNPLKFRAVPVRIQKYRTQSKISESLNELEDQAKTADQILAKSSED